MSNFFEFTPSGVCSQKMIFQIEDDIIQSFEVIGGCNGNLQGIKSLIEGMNIHDVYNHLNGIKCGPRPTSCPDQISKALEAYMAQQ